MSFFTNNNFDPSCFFTEGFENNGFENQPNYGFEENLNRQQSGTNFYEFETPSFIGFGQEPASVENPSNFDDSAKNFKGDFDTSYKNFESSEVIPSDLQENKIDVSPDEFYFDFVPQVQAEVQPEEQPKAKKYITLIIEIDDEEWEKFKNPTHKAEVGTSTTKEDSCFTPESDTVSVFGETTYGDTHFELFVEWRTQIDKYLKGKSEEERNYIYNILPNIFDAIKETAQLYSPVINQEMLEAIIKNLIQEKELMIKEENKMLQRLVDSEVEDISYQRPKQMIESIDLYESKRKSKKIVKGNINHSHLNHLNENYVSNVFQFSKFNYPDDKEVQKIANTRNVSATNFKKMTRVNLDDNVMVRKAKVRIVTSGKELVSNVEYWMNEGYFEQCNEREKYIQHKEKALKDLVLDREL